MSKYQISIPETWLISLEIEAASEKEALDIAQKMMQDDIYDGKIKPDIWFETSPVDKWSVDELA